MPVKSTWQNGEQFNASDANAVAEAVNAAYVKPGTGIPATDLSSGVQLSLGKADTAVQSVSATSITDSTTTGRSVLTAVDAAAARTALGVSYGSTSGTVVQGNDSRLSPNAAAITDSSVVGRAVLTAADTAAARTAIGVAYGTTTGTVVEGNDTRVTGAEQSVNKNTANGYAGLDANGRLPVSLLPNSVMEYQGTWAPTTNTPTLADGTGSAGDVYRVSVAGSRNLGAGSISFDVGDYVIYNGSVWQKADTTDAVSTVAGRTGDVTLAVADVSGAEATANKGAAGGYAGLDSSSKVPVAQLPTGSTSSTVCIGNDARLSDARTPTDAGQVADVSLVAFGKDTARAAGTGDNPFGVKLQRAVTFSSVTYRAATADASGNLVVELRKNGVAVSGSAATIAAASQVAGGTATGTFAFAEGDILTVQVTGVGTTPGKGLVADIKGLTT